jgi:hypothetical protein
VVAIGAEFASLKIGVEDLLTISKAERVTSKEIVDKVNSAVGRVVDAVADAGGSIEDAKMATLKAINDDILPAVRPTIPHGKTQPQERAQFPCMFLFWGRCARKGRSLALPSRPRRQRCSTSSKPLHTKSRRR